MNTFILGNSVILTMEVMETYIKYYLKRSQVAAFQKGECEYIVSCSSLTGRWEGFCLLEECWLFGVWADARSERSVGHPIIIWIETSHLCRY